jgi:hypothetical protein
MLAFKSYKRDKPSSCILQLKKMDCSCYRSGIWVRLEERIAMLYLSVAIADSNLCKMECARIECCCVLSSNRIMDTIIKNNVLQIFWTHLAYYW